MEPNKKLTENKLTRKTSRPSRMMPPPSFQI